MKYVITGGAGHISKPLTLALLQAGHQVTVIGRNAQNLADLVTAGATAAIGSVEDVAFLSNSFTGADAVYTMVPPHFGAQDWKAYIGEIGQNYATAIQQAGVQKVVNLSSIGAHLPDGCGPVSGLYRVEQALNRLENVAIVHLRPAFFFYNHLANIPMIKGMGITGGNYGENASIPMVATEDIANEAFTQLTNLSFTGKTIRYIVSDTKTTNEIASIIGAAVELPNLTWVDFTDEQLLGGLLQAQLPEEIAKNYVEMGAAMRKGFLGEKLKDLDGVLVAGKVDFTHFANNEFKTVFG
ncbi:MAG: hypothetical protein RLY16_1530 [Bacteroidota bacterium]